MGSSFSVDVTAEVDVVPDGGTVSHVSLRHQGRPVLSGLVVQYEGDLVIIDEIVLNECVLPSPTARRLLMALYRTYMPRVGEFGDCGLIAPLNLQALLCDHYDDSREREVVRSMVTKGLRTFSHPMPDDDPKQTEGSDGTCL